MPCVRVRRPTRVRSTICIMRKMHKWRCCRAVLPSSAAEQCCRAVLPSGVAAQKIVCMHCKGHKSIAKVLWDEYISGKSRLGAMSGNGQEWQLALPPLSGMEHCPICKRFQNTGDYMSPKEKGQEWQLACCLLSVIPDSRISS